MYLQFDLCLMIKRNVNILTFIYRSRDQSPTRQLNIPELERVLKRRELKAMDNHSEKIELEKNRQNYEELRDILDEINSLHNQSGIGSRKDIDNGGIISVRAFRLIDELQRLLNETTGSLKNDQCKQEPKTSVDFPKEKGILNWKSDTYIIYITANIFEFGSILTP